MWIKMLMMQQSPSDALLPSTAPFIQGDRYLVQLGVMERPSNDLKRYFACVPSVADRTSQLAEPSLMEEAGVNA